jgi:hypothetical protein
MAVYLVDGAPGRNRTGTPAMNEAADFKSDVSTNFTTGAKAVLCLQVKIKSPHERAFVDSKVKTLVSMVKQH